MNSRSEWNSKAGFLLAALGSAIGLGNIWRFPYMAYRNGGGAFLVPYLVALFIVGIPLLMVEFGLGHHFRRAFPQSLARIHPRFNWIGWWSVCFVMFGIVAYYGVIISWCGNYMLLVLTQPWESSQAVERYFDESFLGAFQDGEPFAIYDPRVGQGGRFHLGHVRWPVLIGLALVWLVNWLISRRQLQRGVELANKIFIPLLVGLTLVMVGWSWNLPGAAQGRQVYLSPDWSLVFEPQTWIDAFSQIFFTLSIGFGIMVAYASYLPAKTDIPTSAFLAALGNCLYSIVGAFAVFAAIGMLAQQRNVDLPRILEVERRVAELEQLQANRPAEFTSREDEYQQLVAENQRNQQFQSQMSTSGLLFKTYPAILTEMGPLAGRVFGVLFFGTLVIAGISSAISIVEAFLSALIDQFAWSRSRSATFLCLAAFALGVMFCFQSGLFWLDLVDHFITTYGLVFVGICEAAIVGWVFTARRLRKHLDEHREFRFSKPIGILVRTMITAMLMITWFGLGRVESLPIGSGLARVALLACAVILWIDEHWFDFDVRLMIPVLLLILLDQALVREFREPYGGYPVPAVIVIGLGWLLATLGIAVILSRVPGHSDASDS